VAPLLQYSPRSGGQSPAWSGDAAVDGTQSAVAAISAVLPGSCNRESSTNAGRFFDEELTNEQKDAE